MFDFESLYLFSILIWMVLIIGVDNDRQIDWKPSDINVFTYKLPPGTDNKFGYAFYKVPRLLMILSRFRHWSGDIIQNGRRGVTKYRGTSKANMFMETIFISPGSSL